MASGKINGKVSNKSEYFSYYIEWNSVANIEGNFSDITVKTYWKTNNRGYDFDTWDTRETTITCDGQLRRKYKRFDTTPSWPQNPYLIQSETFRVNHNKDGNKTITISAYADGTAGSWGTDESSASGSVKLDSIPRASTVNNVSGTIGTTVNITINKAYAGYLNTIKVDGVIIASYTNLSSISYTIPESFYNKIPNAKSGNVTITCDTYNENYGLIGSNSGILTFYVNEITSKPIINPTVIDVNTTTKALTGDENKLIRYLSTARATINSKAMNKASIKSNFIRNGEIESNTETVDYSAVNSGNFYFWTEDTRGFTSETRINKELVPYISLSCDIHVKLNPANNITSINISGNAFGGNFGKVNNTITKLEIAYKEANGQYGQWLQVETPIISENKYSINTTLYGLTYKKKYYFKARVMDAASVAESKEFYIDNLPIANWGKNFFKFNVPVEGIDNVKNASSAESITDSYNGTKLTLRNSEGDIYRPTNPNLLAQWNGNELTYITKDELVNSTKNDYESLELWTGELKGNNGIQLDTSKVKKYLDVYFYIGLGSGGRQLIKYTIDTTIANSTTASFGGGMGMAYETAGGVSYFVSESSYKVNGIFRHSRCGYFRIDDGKYRDRNNADGYYVYKIETHN